MSQRCYNRIVGLTEIPFSTYNKFGKSALFLYTLQRQSRRIFSLEHAFIDKRALGTGLHHTA